MDCSCFPRAFWLFLSVISVFPITSFLFDPKFSKRTISSIRVPIMVMQRCGQVGRSGVELLVFTGSPSFAKLR